MSVGERGVRVFEAPFDLLPGVFFEVSLVAQRIRVGVDIARMLGLAGDPYVEISLAAWFDRVHADDRDQVARALRPTVDDPGIEVVDFRLTGEAVVHVRAQLRRIAGDDGRPLRVTGALIDLSGSVKAQRELARSRAHLGALVENLPNGIISVLDGQTLRFVEVYGHELARLKISESDLIGEPLESVYSTESAALVTRECRRALREARPVAFENHFGSQSYLVHVMPVQIGGESQLLVLSTNITELQQAQDDLRRAKETAEAVNAARVAFIAALGHELRAPLAGIVGLLDLFAEDVDLVDARRRLSLLRPLVAVQRRIIDDLLDLSLLDVDRLSLVVERFSVAEVLAPIGERLHSGLASGAFAAELELPPGSASFTGDPLRIWQILDNLTSNAIKYIESGTVAVRVALGDEGELAITVRDSGIGIAAADLPRIFDSFVRVGAGPHMASGFGLGLAIVKRLVEAMDGTITVESAVGEGSTFRVRIPASAEVPVEAPMFDDDDDARGLLRGRRILIVEDDPVVRVILDEILRREAMVSVEAIDAASATRASTDDDFDAILMDLGLPDRSGLAVIREIRARERERGRRRAPIIALTGHAQGADVHRSLDAGADAHLVKPVSRRGLVQALHELLRRSRGDAAEGPARVDEAAPAGRDAARSGLACE